MAYNDNGVPVRRGKPLQFTFEYEAVEILRRLAANRQAQGILLSALVRQEEQRRIEARRLREQAAMLAETAP